ncbi:conserved Plasmodium protein, unknown function [Babesia microti strain RI]|uniref:Uncharacterized protein n=1 Tax=Babesia microti (strain RI) TaxID=1133968 RepID=I7I7V7_BABMR|nr:conserved Plasmodium protein, unknown function [Babesia microti strain RI]CCF72678.1 conserved Plasmodium protein, unknown function [Babesia microti strain RI]|eukprot:XP_012647287.1 conserved Plasmodium protein, unknown function [Babesia microti strain RI]
MDDIFQNVHFESINVVIGNDLPDYSPLILDLSGRCHNFVTPYTESKESVFWANLKCEKDVRVDRGISRDSSIHVPSCATLHIGDYSIDGERSDFDGYSIAFLRRCYGNDNSKLQLIGIANSCLKFAGRPLFGDVSNIEDGTVFKLYSSSDLLSTNLPWCCLHLEKKLIPFFKQAIRDNTLTIRQQIQISSNSKFRNAMIMICGDETFFVYRSALNGTFMLIGYQEHETVIPIYAVCRSILHINKATVNLQFLNNLVVSRALSLELFLSSCLASKAQVMSHISNSFTPLEMIWNDECNVILVDPDNSCGLQLALVATRKIGPMFTIDSLKKFGIVSNKYDFHYSILALKRLAKLTIIEGGTCNPINDAKILHKLSQNGYKNVHVEIDLYLLHLNLCKWLLSHDTITYSNLSRAVDLILFQSISGKNLQTMIDCILRDNNRCCEDLHYRLKCERCLYICLLEYYYGGGLTVGSFAAKMSAKRVTNLVTTSMSEILEKLKTLEIDSVRSAIFRQVKCFNYLAYQYHTRGFPEIRLSVYQGQEDISFNQLISQLYSPMSCHVSFLADTVDYGSYGGEISFKIIPWQMQFWILRDCLSYLFELKRDWLLERMQRVLYMFFNVQWECRGGCDIERLKGVNWKTLGLDILTGPPTGHTRATLKMFTSSSNYATGEQDLLSSARDLDNFIDLVDNSGNRTVCPFATEWEYLITNANVPIGAIKY